MKIIVCWIKKRSIGEKMLERWKECKKCNNIS